MKRIFSCLFPFCGLGAGALGFLQARVALRDEELTFRSLGGIDVDELGCQDFERLTGSPALRADVATLTSGELRAFAGNEPPDVVFLSPPCKSFSSLLPAKHRNTAKYRSMSRLAVDWFELMLSTWDVPPRLVILENVPRIASLGAPLLDRIKKLLRAAGFVFHASAHDCGVLGGLAQHRRRYLLVARHAERCPPLLYQPPPQRVRACGEVLGELPLPEDPRGGPMHRLPRLSWLNWVRLALIPAGGDWRDLEGVLKTGQPRREVHRRHRVEAWGEASGTVAGSGSNGVANVADPRFGHVDRVTPWDKPVGTVTHSPAPSSGAAAVADPRFLNPNILGVGDWNQPVGTVTGQPDVSKGKFAVADPRIARALGEQARSNIDQVIEWTAPAKTVTGATAPGSGAQSVADPRILLVHADNPNAHRNKFVVTGWEDPAKTVIGAQQVGSGAPSVADPRLGVKYAHDHGYAVLDWREPSPTVAGGSAVGQGAYSVADIRAKGFRGILGVMRWDEAAATVTGNARAQTGTFSVADPRKPPEELIVIVAADGTWHRPLTTLELAALQGMPALVNGEPLVLAGDASSKHRERIGNAVPPPAARAIAEQMLVCLAAGRAGTWQLSGGGAVWVEHESAMQ